MEAALWVAKTGLDAQQTRMTVIANNLANVNTTGFKRDRATFEDLLYQSVRQGGAQTSADTTAPTGLLLGTGTRVVSTEKLHAQGNLINSQNPLDVAILGDGYFQIQQQDGTTAYTRDGSFKLSSTGQLVTSDGFSLQPVITIPNNATSVSISNLGVVSALVPGNTQPQQIGQITLTRFINKTGLESMGDNLFLETAGSGAAIDGTPGSEGFGTIQQGYVEESNVNAVTEISSLIAAQRAYELNARVISASDQMLTAAAQIFRG